jgi:hypothetical protein
MRPGWLAQTCQLALASFVPILTTPVVICAAFPPPAAARQVDPSRRLPATHHEDALLLGGASNALTRRAGGRGGAGRPQPKRVVVDVREFMSSLPAVLHQQVGGRGLGFESGDGSDGVGWGGVGQCSALQTSLTLTAHVSRCTLAGSPA